MEDAEGCGGRVRGFEIRLAPMIIVNKTISF